MAKDPLTVAEVARRSGFAPSALRFYERKGLIAATRTSGGQRRYQRAVLRRLAFIRAARNVGLAWTRCAPSWTPCRTAAPRHTATGAGSPRTGGAGWTSRSPPSRRCATGWTPASAAAASRCSTCTLYNPEDVIGTRTSGAGRLPELLRRPGARERETAGSQRGLPESVVAGG